MGVRVQGAQHPTQFPEQSRQDPPFPEAAPRLGGVQGPEGVVAKGAWAWLPVRPEGLIIRKPHGAAAAVAVGRGSPYGVQEQHREGFWKKSQDDEITICPPIWSVDVSKDTPLCWGGWGIGPVRLPRTCLGNGDPQPHHLHQRLPPSDPSKHTIFVGGQVCVEACGVLVPRPRIELVPSAVKAQSPNHWTTRNTHI